MNLSCLLTISFLSCTSVAMADWISNTEKENVKRQLKIDEGDINKIYKDSLGFPTFGIGHRIKDTDPEHDKPLGTVISDERIYAAFDADLKDAIALTKAIYPCVEGWPSEVKEIMVNMVFNLGGKLRQFVKLGEALNARDWQKAADEMANSKWYGQVGKRAERLVARMTNVKN
ncbi:probable T4-type lysozyme 1 [Dreissena polymorpha]|uniref:probable T4-type lysozyme 1 n=1 Tax=Dreissena polymorpha TaxID=45954 RepID=UPI002264E0F0|nr:probable T4-type lysozyme 1 [Dreissena polymorpha]